MSGNTYQEHVGAELEFTVASMPCIKVTLATGWTTAWSRFATRPGPYHRHARIRTHGLPVATYHQKEMLYTMLAAGVRISGTGALTETGT
jgi:hypothetical protein